MSDGNQYFKRRNENGVSLLKNILSQIDDLKLKLTLDFQISDALNSYRDITIAFNSNNDNIQKIEIPTIHKMSEFLQENKLDDIDNILSELSQIILGQVYTIQNTSIIAVIFSKDRALQVDATIQSLRMNCKDREMLTVSVLYKSSSTVFENQYRELQQEYADVEFVQEDQFKDSLVSVLRNFNYVFWVVDDTIFTHAFSLRRIVFELDAHKNAIGFSLRLGMNTDYCYPLSKHQKIPQFTKVTPDIFKFDWTVQEMDFAYPLEVSSSVYRLKDIYLLLELLDYSNPNQLEDILFQNRILFQRRLGNLLSYSYSKAFSNPVNLVQMENNNKFGNKINYNLTELADLFDRGVRIDVDKFQGILSNACHQEMAYYFYNNSIN